MNEHHPVFDEMQNLSSEQANPRTADIDVAPVGRVLEWINDEDQLVAAAVRRALPDVERAVERTTRALRAGGRLFYVGAGTSGRLGVLDAAECPPTFGTEPNQVVGIIAGGHDAVFRSQEGIEDRPETGRHDVEVHGVQKIDAVVGIAASRRTPYVLGALERARELGADTIFLRCNEGPAPDADVVITVVTGPEVITGSTRMKAGSAQKLVLNMISTATMVGLGKVYGNLMVDLRPNSRKLIERGRGIVMQLTGNDYAAATRLYEDAGRDVRVAVIMARTGLDRDAAQVRLDNAGGRLARALGER